MKIQLISIDPSVEGKVNIGILTQSALILDQEDFLQHVSELREDWELTQLVEPSNLEVWFNGYHPTFKLTHWAADVLDSASQKISNDSSVNDIIGSQFDSNTAEINYQLEQKAKEYAYLNPLNLEIDILLKRFSIPEEFRSLITKSVVCGAINETDYDFPLIQPKPGNWFYENINLEEQITEYNFDSKNELLRDREWYRLKRQGLSYSKIAKQDHKRGKINLGTYTKRVKDQIKRYREFLKKGASFRKK